RSRLQSRDDEVGALTRSFDHMADRIEDLFNAQQESEAQVRRFIADASHELRTPVTALKGYIDVLRRGAGRDPVALDSSLEAMAVEADRMRHLVLDLLTLARIDARRALQPEALDVNQELGSVLDEGVPGMPATVERRFAPPALVVNADRIALHTIARNLLVNACKYASGARQRWSTSVDGERVRIDVHDDGPGIAPADLPHVFERFYRGEKTRAREEGGSGLGLSIVQGLARSMGGEVAVFSAEGAGTTVSVWLPRPGPA
ncbi:MAG: sensor histidine kinase, partial [Candidatus Dormibacteria bacterium]